MNKEEIEEFEAGAKWQQETLEEAMEKNGYHNSFTDETWREGVEFGVKWQQEQDKYSYSEEEVVKLIDDITKNYDLTPVTNPEIKRQLVSQFINSKTIFEQFKKK